MNACAVCRAPAPAAPDDYLAEGWFHVDADTVAGPLPPVWICGAHRTDDEAGAVLQAIRLVAAGLGGL